jgi:Flp pilus assembly protein TadB
MRAVRFLAYFVALAVVGGVVKVFGLGYWAAAGIIGALIVARLVQDAVKRRSGKPEEKPKAPRENHWIK